LAGNLVQQSATETLRRIRHAPDVVLHNARRRAALRKIIQVTTPRSVLFVCHGNICRSPFAAALFTRSMSSLLADRLQVASAGFTVGNRAAPAEAVKAAAAYDVDLSQHRSRIITPELLRSADLIIVVSSDQARALAPRARADAALVVLGDLDTQPITRRTILDPWNGTESAFDESYARIARCIKQLLAALEPLPQ
jgi:protein-tyrosine phosphatase